MMAISIQAYYLFGVENYRTNLTGYLILFLPLILIIFMIWKRYRGKQS